MIDIAFSPCPNDTFLFDAWVQRKIASPLPCMPHLADIQKLNVWALEGRFPVTKVSAFCLALICDQYQMLPVGAAIGHFGPKLIAKEPMDIASLQEKRVAIPGEQTTAHLLFRVLLGACKGCVFCRYDEVVPLVVANQVDCGVIIHETRFTFQREGLVEVCDLGSLFQQRYRCQVPLGVVVAKKSLPEKQKNQIIDAMKQSLLFAKKNPESAKEYILQHAQEKEEAIIQSHIDAYVTSETLQVSHDGLHSIHTLFELGIKEGLLPKTALDFIK